MSTRNRKYSSFWPLPRGIENYVLTLIQILNYILKNNPTKNQLIKWILGFPTVNTVKNAGGYVNSMLKHSGLLIFGDEISLSESGEIFLNSKDNKVLFRIFDENILGFNETLRLIGNRPHTIKELHKELVEVLSDYNISWTTNTQPRWRIYWLKSMGFVETSRKRISLTEMGEDLLKELDMPIISVKQPIDEPVTISVRFPEVKKTAEKEISPINQVESIIVDLEKFEHASSEPDKYEIAIMEAFIFLGFEAEHRGEPGSTDVIAVANLGPWKYSMIIDGKTTKSDSH